MTSSSHNYIPISSTLFSCTADEDLRGQNVQLCSKFVTSLAQKVCLFELLMNVTMSPLDPTTRIYMTVHVIVGDILSLCRHPTNGCVLVRSSQPQVGVLGIWRSPEDEKFLLAISHACTPSLPRAHREGVYQNGGPPCTQPHVMDEVIPNGGPGACRSIICLLLLYDVCSGNFVLT